MCICDLNGIGAMYRDNSGFALGRIFKRFFGKHDKAVLGRVFRPLCEEDLNKITSDYYVADVTDVNRMMLLIYNRNVYEVNLRYEYIWKAHVDFSNALFDVYKSGEVYTIFDCPYSEEDLRDRNFIERQSEIRKFILLNNEKIYKEQQFKYLRDVYSVHFFKDKNYIFVHPGRYERNYNLHSYIYRPYHTVVLRYESGETGDFFQTLIGHRGLKHVEDTCQVLLSDFVGEKMYRKDSEGFMQKGSLYECVFYDGFLVAVKNRCDMRYPDRECYYIVVYAASRHRVTYQLLRKHFKKKGLI